MPRKSPQKTAQINLLNKALLVLLVAVIFLISWLWIKPTLVFFGQGRIICSDIYIPWKNIFAEQPFYPGLCVDWLVSILSYTIFHSNLAAAIIISALAISLCTIASKIAKSFGKENFILICAIPASLLMIQYARYYHSINESLSILLAAIVFYCYNKTKFKPEIKITLFFICASLIYIIIPKGLLAFALLCVTAEVTQKNFRHSIILLITAILSPWLCNLFIFKTDLAETYQTILIFHAGQGYACNIISNLSIIYWPALIILCKIKKQPKSSPPGFFSKLSPVLAIVLIAAAVFSLADYSEKNKRIIDYYSYNKSWPKLLNQAATLSGKNFDMLVCHDVNRALYYEKLLAYDMFDYPQHYESLLLNNKKELTGGILWVVYPKLGEIYYELADINAAERYTCEALELLGYYPRGLKQLALINIIKEQYTTAEIYLKALHKDPLYKKWAKEYLEKLSNPQLFKLDKNIAEKRKLWIGDDKDMTNRYSPLDMFIANNKNRMAFEYMMAFCLLTCQHNVISNSIKFLDNFDYPKGHIPKLYEQGILLYTQITRQKADLQERTISAESLKTFQRFSQEASTAANLTAQQAGEILADNFLNTYYFYYHFLRPEK